MIGEATVGADMQQARGVALGRGLLCDQLGWEVEVVIRGREQAAGR
jgi:hypothetical protein